MNTANRNRTWKRGIELFANGFANCCNVPPRSIPYRGLHLLEQSGKLGQNCRVLLQGRHKLLKRVVLSSLCRLLSWDNSFLNWPHIRSGVERSLKLLCVYLMYVPPISILVKTDWRQAVRDSGRKNDQKNRIYNFFWKFAAFSAQSRLFRTDEQKRRDALLQNILQFDRISCRNTSKKKKVQMTFRPSAQLF